MSGIHLRSRSLNDYNTRKSNSNIHYGSVVVSNNLSTMNCDSSIASTCPVNSNAIVPTYNDAYVFNQNGLPVFNSGSVAPHSPETVMNWQFGDAPAQSPRRDVSSINLSAAVAPVDIPLSPSTKPQVYGLDNQFFTGGLLDWDVDAISTVIEENKRNKRYLDHISFNDANNNNEILDQDMSDFFGDVFDYEELNNNTSCRFIGSTASITINEHGPDHKRCASFTCFPNETDTSVKAESDISPLKKKKKLGRCSSNPTISTEKVSSTKSKSSSSSSSADPTKSNPKCDDSSASDSKHKPKTRSLIRSSGFRGVSRCSKDGRWQARIRVGVSVRYLGRFLTQEEAALCYDKAAREFHGDKAILNFIGPGDEHLAQSKKFSKMGKKSPAIPSMLSTKGGI